MVRRLLLMVLGFILVMGVAGCGDGIPIATTGNIEGWVVYYGNNTNPGQLKALPSSKSIVITDGDVWGYHAISGAKVTVVGTSIIATANQAGYFKLTGLAMVGGQWS